MADRLDILIFGATGFTGLHCIPYVAKLSKDNGRNLSWGVAGRSEEKLKKVLKDMGEKIESNLDSIPIVIADINSYESLVDMAKKTKLVINCCGPYRFLGDAVVKACIEAGAHHVDVSGEPEFMERVQVEQHEAAQEKGVYVVSACGLDSIPTDMGIVYLQQKFEGTLNSVESFLKFWNEGPVQGPSGNRGTWDSIVHGVGNIEKLHQIRKCFNEKYKKPPTYVPKLAIKTMPFKPNFVKGWALPFLGSDRSVARRTQGWFYEYENRRPVQIGTYFMLPSLMAVFGFGIFGALLLFLAKFSFGRKLLLKYPKIFSAGLFSDESPSEEVIQNSWFSIDFYGQGWKEKLANKDDQYATPVDSCIRAKVKAQNPGYGATCIALVLAGIMVLTQTDKMPNKGQGGVYSPGAAFAKTSLVKELIENGFTFEILSQEDIKS